MHNLVCGVTPLPTVEIDNQSFTFYPNPAYDEMSLKFNENTEGSNFDVAVFDGLGRSVLSLKNQAISGFRLRKSDVGGAGFYFVKMRFVGNDKTIVKKVVFN